MATDPVVQMKPRLADMPDAADVTAIEALTGTGLAARTADNTWALRTLTAPAAGITVTNGGGVAGDPTLALANDLAAYEGLATSGVVVRTGDGTASTRTITAPAAGITVTNGDGVAGDPTLALANDLAAYEGLAANGLVARTGDGSAAVRTLTAPAAGVTVTNGDGVSGNPTLALANDLAALEGLSGSGIIARTATDTMTVRTITAPAAGITVSNGDGVSGNPTLALANDLAALEGLASAGMIARTGDGTAAVRTLTAGSGISITDGDGVGGNPTISATGGTGTVTSVAITAPAILSVSGSPVTTSGTLALSLATQTANTVFSGPTTGAAATPAFRALVSDDVPNISAAKITSGTLDAARLPTHTHSAADITSGTLAIGRGGTGVTSTPTNGQVLIGNGSGYVAAAITAGSGVTVTNGSGSITIAASGGADLFGLCELRMSSNNSGVPVPISDAASITEVQVNPLRGARIGIYNTSTSAWEILTVSSTFFGVPTGTAGHIYDVFAYNSFPGVAYELTSWGGSSSRSSALAYLNGVLVKSSDNSRRYIGSFRLDTTNTTCDTRQKRFIWNYYNRVQQELFSEEGGASHTYNTATWREWNNSTSYRLEYIVGLVEDAPAFSIYGGISGTGDPRIAFAFNSATTPLPSLGLSTVGVSSSVGMSMTARRGVDAVLGYNYVTALQYTGSSTGTFDKLQLTATIQG